jgi:hypothetical protein
MDANQRLLKYNKVKRLHCYDPRETISKETDGIQLLFVGMGMYCCDESRMCKRQMGFITKQCKYAMLRRNYIYPTMNKGCPEVLRYSGQV